MANEFKIRKGLIVEGASGGTVVDVQGSQGQLFSVTDDLSGSIFAVSDISGVPIFDVNSNGGSVFTGLVSGITPVVADNFVTKGYVDGTGGGTGPFLPLAAGSGSPLTGDLYQTMGAIGVAQTDQDYIAKIYELNSDGFLSLYTGQPTPLERIRISSYGDSFFVPANNGRIGIGTTTPVETLTVPGGSGVMLGFKRFYSNTGTIPAGVGSSYTLTANLNIEQGATLTGQYQYKFYLTTVGTGTYNSSVYIVYRNSADNAWDVHRVSSTGLTSNHPELTVSGTSALIYNDHPAAYNVSYRVETSYTGQAKTSPQIFGSDYMWTRDNTDLYYMDGDVGIGVSSPSFKLDVAGAIQTTGSLRITTANPGIIFKETDITDKNWDIQVNNGNLKFYEVNDARTVFNEHVTFGAGGNVGIGFTSPQAAPLASIKLSVDGDTYVSGNVGIGTTTPSNLLSLKGAGNNWNTSAAIKIWDSLYSQGWYVGSANNQTSGDFYIRSVAAEADYPVAADQQFTIKQTGKVGLGLLNPAKQLTIRGSEPWIRLEEDSASNKRLDLWVDPTSAIAYIGANQSAQKLVFQTGSSDRINILNNGNVGIGTTTPSHKLEVGLTSSVALAAQPAIPLLVSNDGNSVDGRVFIQVKNDVVNGASAIGAGLQMTAAGVTSGTASYENSLIFLQSKSPGNQTIHSAPQNIKFYVDNDGTFAGAGANYNDFGDAAFELKTSGDGVFYNKLGVGVTAITGNFNSYISATRQVTHNGNGGDLSVISDNNNNPVMFIKGTGTADLLDIQGTQGQSFSVTNNLSGDIFSVADISGVPLLNVNSNGTSYFDSDLGIGTTTPDGKLEVSSNTSLSSYVTQYTNDADGAELVLRTARGTQSSPVRYNTNDSAGRLLFQAYTSAGSFRDAASIESIMESGYANAYGGLRFNYMPNTAPYTLREGMSIKMNGDVLIPGDVGIGTTNPSYKLDINNSVNENIARFYRVGSATSISHLVSTGRPQTRYSYDGQQTWYVGNNIGTFGIGTGYLASTDPAFNITSTGYVGIHTTNPSYLLDVRDGTTSGAIARFTAINPHVIIESSTAGNSVLHFKPNTTGTKSGQFKVTAGNGYNFKWTNDAAGTGETIYMDLDTSTTGGGDLTVKGDIIAYGAPSDKKYKENIKPIESALDKAMQLQGVTFDWKDSESILDIKEDIGFIAQDVEKVLPELVRDNGKGNLSLRYQGITPVLLEAIKELKAEIDLLKSKPCNCNNCNCNI